MNRVLSNKKIIAIFILPTLILYTIFVLIPIGYNVYLSLYQTDLISKNRFIGFRNYTNLISDKIFLQSLKNNGLLVLGSLIAHLPLALFFGNMIFKKIQGSHFFQSVFFLPSVICGAGVGMLFNMVYNSEFGIVNALLKAAHLENWQHAWLSEESTVMIALIVVVMWKYVGYHMVIQLAAMKSIPTSLYEAAEIDGATSFQQFTKITFPLIKHVIKIDTVLIITGSLKYFDLIWSMTKGGPNHASEVLATYMYYQGFRTMKFGYASAIGVVLLVLCVLVIWIVNHIIKTEKISY
ncbi:carbohydrate ABC transporter permease [Anaerocolumna sp. MB42-C2]|uniref:carbohydrate ABC transporter permease n=1 Tax=Anaerocolumna sp. MB42-C2 TaxID=3070997 RepID=UPI0027E1C86F|nr:sugar ABC transporter permease [Anaerocolumna sp. MB42-C2]WMJ85510.1 sugar ABC transporter permease [Anaerocolumna sp. MB42-C2]